jgi:hypothetical protein
MLLARHPVIFLPLICGIISGIMSIVAGCKGLRYGKIQLTRKKSLFGPMGMLGSIFALIGGIALIVMSLYGWTLTPE